MPQYIGFSTLRSCEPKSTNLPQGNAGGAGSILSPIVFGKKFRMVDSQLVTQNLLNAFNIRFGEKVGQPQYGTRMWDFLFDPNTADLQFAIENEVRRVASLDSRIQLNTVKSYPKENGILIEIELAVSPFNQAEVLSVFFDSFTNRAAVQQP